MTADVTVVMPAMNRAHLIGRALDSISAQTVKPRSVIVVDDASRDDTVEVARTHGAEVIQLPVNGGSGPARNRGIEAATTTWIAFLDSDDSWSPTHLETVLASGDEYAFVTSPGIATGGRVLGNSSGRLVRLTPQRALSMDLICTSGTLVRRDALLAAGLFRPLRRAQDLDMWVRVLAREPGVALPAPGFEYHLHDQQAILDTELMRACFKDIVDDCSRQAWFSSGDEDRAWVKWHWDDLRRAQSSRNRAEAMAQTHWFAQRPHTWTTLQRLLRLRRSGRRMLAPAE